MNKIHFDAQSSLLSLRSDSILNGETIFLLFQSNSFIENDSNVERYLSAFIFSFSSSPRDYNSKCEVLLNATVQNLPTGEPKIWTIRKTTTFLKVNCNEVFIMNVQYSTMPKRCEDMWSYDSMNFKIGQRDTATDAYAITRAVGNINKIFFNFNI